MTDPDDGPAPRPVARLEWAVAALGAALACGVLGVLAYEALTYEDGPPVLVATLRDVTATPGGHVARFVLENRGPSAAAEVTVAARLKEGGAVVEETEVTLDYVARMSSREAGVVFERDPKGAQLDIRAASYRRP
ncbi:TIGR02588 family protein [Methylopila musalis]|uniref:TIGR02588 family protein n=1 Tax=Methylopila musalis TaxID=1134781 RepID=A0ABW3Z6A5_9HYPH